MGAFKLVNSVQLLLHTVNSVQLLALIRGTTYLYLFDTQNYLYRNQKWVWPN